MLIIKIIASVGFINSYLYRNNEPVIEFKDVSNYNQNQSLFIATMKAFWTFCLVVHYVRGDSRQFFIFNSTEISDFY